MVCQGSKSNIWNLRPRSKDVRCRHGRAVEDCHVSVVRSLTVANLLSVLKLCEGYSFHHESYKTLQPDSGDFTLSARRSKLQQ